ncbi:peptidyl-prolyl cis-trans isomerase [Zobellia russellii]|uniref:peptidyl-prolyl cis-trans isomerase n=1 Tax=Zobellia russellii TaxID=248907 RepID=UPI001BFFD061|nr:peptidyl-prolyl cis-trans isomerase [Zobellia russellii]MBT9190230.1 peptidyl-prolyl cis-trans isomerase [Zobellia russellii]
MRLKITPLCYLVRCWAVMATLSLFVGCGSFLAKDEPGYLARVGENYLYREDVAKLLAKGISKEDSASFVTNYINNWASKQLLLEKAKINLPEEKLAAYDVLVSDYRTDLYTRAYKEALVQQDGDTVISASQLNGFYEREKENFKLKEKIVKLRFVELPTQFLNKDDVISKLKRFKKDDISYLDSIGVQFKKLNFNDSIWVSATRIIEEIPPLTFENADKHLKKSQFFELEDANGVYLAKVTDVLDVNDVAPLSFIEPTIKQVLLSRRKLDYLRKLETEIIDEAIKEKEFEVYEQGE